MSTSSPGEKLRRKAIELISNNAVDVILGYRRGTLPFRSQPVFVRSKESASEMIFDFTCENNLVAYLPKLKNKRVGLVVKGCDSKALVENLREQQFDRDNLVLMEMPCSGVIDRKNVDEIAGDREITWFGLEGGVVSFGGYGWKESRPFERLVHDSCKQCDARLPGLEDTILTSSETASALESPVEPTFDDVETLESMEASRRWDYFLSQAGKCIRCYACIKACPACYCKECFVDRSKPAWIGKTTDTSDIMMFHIIRALHLGGRCVDCGACARACPMGVDLRFLNRKLQKDAFGLFGHISGSNPDSLPLLCDFRAEDPNEFIR